MVAASAKGERFIVYKKIISLSLLLAPGYGLHASLGDGSVADKVMCAHLAGDLEEGLKKAAQSIKQKCQDDCDGTTAARKASEAAQRRAAEDAERNSRASRIAEEKEARERDRRDQQRWEERQRQQEQERMDRRDRERQEQFERQRWERQVNENARRSHNNNDPYKRGGR
jgi:hypothetical protein